MSLLLLRAGALEQAPAGGGGGGGALDPDNYTTIEGVNGGTITKETDTGRLKLGMTNDGSGKVLFKPSVAIDTNGGEMPNPTENIGVAFVIDDHAGWDGTAAWLGFGLGFVTSANNLSSIQLQSRDHPTSEYGHFLERSSGFITTVTTSWSSSRTGWGEGAITPKTTPIYVGCFYDNTTNDLIIYRGDGGAESWTEVHRQDGTPDPAATDEYGLLLFCLTGTQAFDVYLSAIEWEWNGSSWPAGF